MGKRWLRGANTALGLLAVFCALPSGAQQHVSAGQTVLSKEEQLAKQLANPIAALISVPFQLNYDHDIGRARGGERWTLNI